ncbi:MAG: diguanylate cyclase [Candidatus Omnitrophica bacterium]|nr:diguanylate cyclase [Candidatus Omnitrophota bacterium]
MIDFLKKMSLVPKGLRYKTMIAFCLMSLIPLLICFWLVTTYIFPNINLFFGLSMGNISLILVISLFISMLGLYVTKEMIDPVLKIADDARGIAEGDTDKVIDVYREDEIGELGTSLNIMTQKIRENIEELKAYGERTKLINIEINKKVLALSGLLQIGNLISSSKELQTVLDFIAQKLSDVEDGSAAILMLLDEETGEFKVASSCNIADDRLEGLSLRQDETAPNTVVVDKDSPASTETLKRFLAALGLKNIAAMPIVVARKQYGVLAVGNKKQDFAFKDDEKELLKVFLKQTCIAVENDLLIRRAKELAVKDELTGLYNQSYIHTRLDEEIKRAVMYQRPCGYLLIDMDGFRDFHERFGEAKTETLLKALGELLKGAVTEVDKVARLAADRFAIVLPERNKKQAATVAEDVRKKIEGSLGRVMKTVGNVTVSIGVSENPIDGSTADELMEKAERLVKSAKSLGKNRVAV